MICSFCSLLCDAEHLEQLVCKRRERALVQLDSLRASGSNKKMNRSQNDETEFLEQARASLRNADRVLITGRIASVQSARAAVSLASKLDATIDCSVEGDSFKNIAAIQRFGLNSVSLAEARDHSEMFVMVGDDGILDICPRLPHALRGSDTSKQTVLLLGQFTSRSVQAWRSVGFNTWSIPCQIQDVPTAISQWYRWSLAEDERTPQDSDLRNGLFRDLSTARYTTVLWCAENIVVDQADLWVERMLQWIATRNETKRCGALPWSSLDGTFQQVCTWLTGFPGRVTFKDGLPSYDPHRYKIDRWMEGCSLSGVSSVVVHIDETVGAATPWPAKFFQSKELHSTISITPESEVFPTLVAGAEVSADTFRADLTLLAHIEPSLACRNPLAQTAAHWLERLAP